MQIRAILYPVPIFPSFSQPFRYQIARGEKLSDTFCGTMNAYSARCNLSAYFFAGSPRFAIPALYLCLLIVGYRGLTTDMILQSLATYTRDTRCCVLLSLIGSEGQGTQVSRGVGKEASESRNLDPVLRNVVNPSVSFTQHSLSLNKKNYTAFTDEHYPHVSINVSVSK